MNTVDVTLTLPEDLAERAKAAGILTSERLIAWLEKELERKERVDRLLADIAKLSAIQPPLTQEEIDAEIAADRREQAEQAK
ncbi:MAG: hypothetical protein IT324_32875 [Anaerolineae bacterium]|nr:hypothetical protein [Anaerolineae bacterium]